MILFYVIKITLFSLSLVCMARLQFLWQLPNRLHKMTIKLTEYCRIYYTIGLIKYFSLSKPRGFYCSNFELGSSFEMDANEHNKTYRRVRAAKKLFF